MFKLPEDFDREWPLHRVIVPSDGKTITAEIGPLTIHGWDISTRTTLTETVEEIVLHENTYKHYKFYTSGEQIDQIQTLAHHTKAHYNFGADEDGDVFWEVRFKLSDFKEVVRE